MHSVFVRVSVIALTAANVASGLMGIQNLNEILTSVMSTAQGDSGRGLGVREHSLCAPWRGSLPFYDQHPLLTTCPDQHLPKPFLK